MPKNEENVLVIRRALFDELGAFQGLERDADRYIETFMTRQNNFFLPRSRAEQDPAFKQIIPYIVFTFEGTILRYVRGAKSGEKRLVDKASIGIGGHINDSDESLFSFDKDAYRAAVHREVTEELKFEGNVGGSPRRFDQRRLDRSRASPSWRCACGRAAPRRRPRPGESDPRAPFSRARRTPETARQTRIVVANCAGRLGNVVASNR